MSNSFPWWIILFKSVYLLDYIYKVSTLNNFQKGNPDTRFDAVSVFNV